jgi:hypothetical protein
VLKLTARAFHGDKVVVRDVDVDGGGDGDWLFPDT